jgi:hypothetical protein
MPYTYPPPYFETTGTPANSHDGLKEFATFLNGVHATQANTVPWACIDCYDGVTREQPADGSFANLTSGNLWRPENATPGTNSWAVFQAPSGGPVAARYQVYVEMSAGSAVFLGIFMLNDWVVGGGTDANPAIPATSIGAPPFAGGMDSTIPNFVDYKWKAIVDEGGVILDVFPTVAGDRRWVQLGDLVPENEASEDPRPFVISTNTIGDNWNGSYRHISVVDDTTVVSDFTELEMAAPMYDVDDQDAFTERPLCSVSCRSITLGNQYRKGKFRNIAAISRHARGSDDKTRVTAGATATDYSWEIWGRSGTIPHLVTIYPPGVALDSHVEIVESTIPKTLDPGA